MIGSRKKWRPSIAMVIAVVCAALVSVPLLALLAVRLTSNQFVRETEQSLIQQGAIYAEIYAEAFTALDGPLIGTALDDDQKKHWNANLHPARAQLNVRRETVAPPRPDGEPVTDALDQRHADIIGPLLEIARRSQRTTLAGVVFLDHTGRELNADGAPSLATVTEVQTALNGDIGAKLRARDDDYEPHAFSSLSRDTGFRVFLTYPVIVQDRVIGVVYLSRTPLNLGKFLFQERYALLTMLVSTVIGATLIGLLLLRLISRPVHALRDASRTIAADQQPAANPVLHYGLRELADLGDSVSTMAETLSRRSQEISTYTDHVTHELKSPVTAVIGAAELLQDEALNPKDRAKLLGNIETQVRRMNRLLSRLRDMTRLRSTQGGKPGQLVQMLPQLDGPEVVMDAAPETTLPLSVEHGQMILHHMAQNSLAHGAQVFRVEYADNVLRVSDDGDGITENDSKRVTEPFFTTRRDQGGTGMGLSIVVAVLDSYGATLDCLPSAQGAVFEIRFRNAG
ncbi:Signal transduction histidine kinase [Litoreibacter ascidiaceicola]|uniref:histidine kinase n=2 Tax=Litoreibacter ascidiaceicola TaxID=1486859 RepID=A0A1M5CML9_9RHOB|nr:Signal transduction histidine kinase [Litoreibacter ascidiaceicola]